MNKCILFFASIVLLSSVSCSEDSIENDTFGSISGVVTSQVTDEPLGNVKITTNPSSSTVFTNGQGNFTLSNVLVDSYSVQAELDGFTTGFEGVEVVEGLESEVAIELNLSVNSNSAPSPPELIFPEDGAEDVPLEVELAWDATDPEDDELIYTVQLRNGSTNEIEEFQVVADTTLTVSNLSLATNYFWQVEVEDVINEPVSSGISSFTTFAAQDNPIVFVKRVDGNSVVFSGSEAVQGNGVSDLNVIQLTSESKNSFRPKRNNDVDKIAFLRTVNGENQIFTMNLAGTNQEQITDAVPVAGFRQESIQFTWAENGQRLYYPNFNRLYAINNDGSGLEVIYETTDGSLISEVAVSSLDTDTILIKTNNVSGYDAKIFAISRQSGTVLYTVLEDVLGAVSGIDVTANVDSIVYSRDLSQSQNSDYRIFESRVFIYDVMNQTTSQFGTDVNTGQNDLFPSYSPDEGRLILTRVLNNAGAIPSVFSISIGNNDDNIEFFTSAFMPDWE